ncbi:MAG: hypothetical protein V1747_03545 [Candidatus Omnitrophota bacterium]
MEISGNKTYYFTATLNPPDYCYKFNPGELDLGGGYRLDIFFNGISIWNPSLEDGYVKVAPFVYEAFHTLITSFIFRENIVYENNYNKLSFTVNRCIEAMNTKAEHNLIWTLDYAGKMYTPNKDALPNVTWRKVAKFFPVINSSFFHKIMLKDYYNCINDPGDNAFFFAYRILEDIREAINSEKGITKEKHWSEMHVALKTNTAFMKPLTEVATEVRHGKLRSKIVAEARKERKEILDIAFHLMKKEFKRKFPGFI